MMFLKYMHVARDWKYILILQNFDIAAQKEEVPDNEMIEHVKI